MQVRCDFKEQVTDEKCRAEAKWIADIARSKDAASYEGTSWRVALCEAHYERLRAAGRITGTAHEVTG